MVDSVMPAPTSPPPTPIPGVDPYMPPIPVDKAKLKADKIAADKVIADKAKADMDNGTKVLGDMEHAIGDKLHKMHGDMEVELSKVHAAFLDMPEEIQDHPAYKPLGLKISSVTALLNTLGTTAAAFPMPVKEGGPMPPLIHPLTEGVPVDPVPPLPISRAAPMMAPAPMMPMPAKP